MSWLTQTNGLINKYEPRIHIGTQPVRVIHHMLIYLFQRTSYKFLDMLKEKLKRGVIPTQINFIYGEESIRVENGKLRTPRINIEDKNIELHESFLSFLWCCTYSVFVTYVETIDYPRINKANGTTTHPISQDKIDEAKQLFDYARSLIVTFINWDKNELPNPEIYEAENRDYVEQTNCYYTEAVKFILCHEYTHLESHVEQLTEETSNSQFLAFEIEADNNAVDMMVEGISNLHDPISVGHKLAVEIGIIFGVLSMFFFRAQTEGVKHPNAEDRLTNVLEKLTLEEEHYAWGIACVGLQMWDEQFKLNFNWDNPIISYRDQYYKIVHQIKGRQ